MSPATYNLIEVAALFGIGKSAAYNAAKNGTLPVEVIKIGGRYVVPKAPVDALLGINQEAA